MYYVWQFKWEQTVKDITKNWQGNKRGILIQPFNIVYLIYHIFCSAVLSLPLFQLFFGYREDRLRDPRKMGKNSWGTQGRVFARVPSHPKLRIRIEHAETKEMDYHCIEKPYILFLVQYWANLAWMFIYVPNH